MGILRTRSSIPSCPSWNAIFVIFGARGPVYRGLQDCFGANIIAGYRRHRATLNHATRSSRDDVAHTGRTFRSAHEFGPISPRARRRNPGPNHAQAIGARGRSGEQHIEAH